MAWALQDAKAKFSEVVARAQTDGPQEVTRHGRPVAVIVSKAEFDEVIAHRPARPKMSLGRYLLAIPRGGADDLFDRPEATGREIEF